jgi:hypothetical protein
LRIRLTKNLEPLRASALARLDQIIGERLYALTASPVAILRTRKAAEAELFLAVGSVGPLLRVEAEVEGIPVADLVDTVLDKATAAGEAMAAIEIRRQAAQAAIRSAQNPAAIEVALEEILNG